MHSEMVWLQDPISDGSRTCVNELKVEIKRLPLNQFNDNIIVG